MLFRQAGVPLSSIFVTNSRGLIWRNSDGGGSFRNEEQKQFAQARWIWVSPGDCETNGNHWEPRT